MSPIHTRAQPRYARKALVAFAALTAFSAPACGSSGNTGSAPPRSWVPATPPSAKHSEHHAADHVTGLIASVSGNTVDVTKKDGTATISFGQSTTISEISAAQLSDVIAGRCIGAMTPPGSNPPIARRIMIWPDTDGTCVREHPKEQQRSSSPTAPSGKRPEHEGIHGEVESVSGNTITIAGTDPDGSAAGPVTVTVTSDTTYAMRAPADQKAISVGKCIAAHGDGDASGNLQATSITLRAPKDGSCDGGGHQGHHQR